MDTSTPTVDALLRKQQVAELLGISVSHVNRLLAAGTLRGLKLGARSVRVAQSELARFRSTIPQAAFRAPRGGRA